MTESQRQSKSIKMKQKVLENEKEKEKKEADCASAFASACGRVSPVSPVPRLRLRLHRSLFLIFPFYIRLSSQSNPPNPNRLSYIRPVVLTLRLIMRRTPVLSCMILSSPAYQSPHSRPLSPRRYLQPFEPSHLLIPLLSVILAFPTRHRLQR